MQAFFEGRPEGDGKAALKKLKKSFEKGLTKRRVYDILFELSKKRTATNIEN